jgi:hypothetical protein
MSIASSSREVRVESEEELDTLPDRSRGSDNGMTPLVDDTDGTVVVGLWERRNLSFGLG